MEFDTREIIRIDLNGAKALLVVVIFIRWLKPTAIEFKIGFWKVYCRPL